jgi:acid phosphatase family membrane protein YuiD
MDAFWQSVKDFFGNYMLISAMSAWLCAQIIKIFTGVFQNRKMSLTVILFSTGGMPSSHAAAVVALATAAGLSQGFGSPMFAVCGVLSVIVMIDASGVRYETGKQATIINKITKELFSGKVNEINTGLKELVGHTPVQVFAGFLLGVAVATAMFFIM